MDESAFKEKAKRAIMRFLSFRDRTEKEVGDKLRKMNLEEDLIGEIISEFKSLGFLNNERFTKQRVRYLAQEHLLGDLRIKADLLAKGVSEEQINDALKELRSELPEEEAIKLIIKRKKRSSSLDRKEEARFARMLRARGFSSSLICESLKHLKEEKTSWQ
ncbi:MAG: recombination regulator RecX [Syntrophales bacterium]|nr:recombination regulator RecX [Syntrophales bacterium]